MTHAVRPLLFTIEGPLGGWREEQRPRWKTTAAITEKEVHSC
jgi:hypothetical protein